MKRILIIGENSYIGTSFVKWLERYREQYNIDIISSMHNDWKTHSFSDYDSILHVAGIAHVSSDPKLESLYYRVNRDLAIDVARKAKAEGVRQFIFMSSMIIYGDDGRIFKKKIVYNDTHPEPSNFYGQSKLEADLSIQEMSSEEFSPVIIRTPVVYGPGCKGNFPKLLRLAAICPVFPDICNERSMIYIDNLCEFLRLSIDNNVRGVFYPQNKEYGSTKDIVKTAANIMGKKVLFVKFFNPVLRLLSLKVRFINKVFGNKVYDKTLSKSDFGEYNFVDFTESVKRCIK